MRSDSFYRLFFHFFLLMVIICICYSNTLDSSWHFDDLPNINHNKNIHIKSLSWDELKKAFVAPPQNSRPVSNFSFALNYYISELDTTSYHVVNIAIHFLCSFFVYLVFLQTLQLYCDREKEGWCLIYSIYEIALLGAVLWAIHPIHTQAVTYIVQRMASMAAMFYMVSFWCYLRFRLSSRGKRQVFLLFLSIFFWLMGLGSKENAILLPLSIIAYEYAFFNTSGRKLVKLGLYLAGLILIGLIFVLLIREMAIKDYFFTPYDKRPFTMWQRLITEPLIMVRYIALLLCPLANFLTLESDIVASVSLFDPPITIIANLLIFSLVVFGVIFLRRFPLLCFAIVFYFINHLLESTFLGLEMYFEHRNYIPSIFIYLVLAYYSLKVCSYYGQRGKVLMQSLFILLLVAILISEGNAAYLRNDIWENEITSLSDAIEKAPMNLRPYISISAEYIRISDYDTALKYLREAEEMYKKYPNRYQDNWLDKLYYNAGVVYLKKEDFQKAILLHNKSLAFYNENWKVHVNLGYLFFKVGDLKNAQTALVNAMRINDKEPDLYNMYGRILYATDKLDAAVDVFQKGLQVGETSELRLDLIAAYIKKGELHLARKELIKMPHSSQDLAYLLYRAFLFPGEDRHQALDKIAYALFESKVAFCEWLTSIEKNNFPGIIYPDISPLKEDLKETYLNILIKIQDEMENTAQIVKDCSLEQVVN